MCLAAGLPTASGFVHDPPVSDPKPTSLKEPGEPDPADSSSESRLIEEAQQGSSRAAGALFERYRSWLRKRMRGRLPPWARGSLDTSDLVQDALHHTFVRLNEFKSHRASALRVYFRRSVERVVCGRGARSYAKRFASPVESARLASAPSRSNWRPMKSTDGRRHELARNQQAAPAGPRSAGRGHQ